MKKSEGGNYKRMFWDLPSIKTGNNKVDVIIFKKDKELSDSEASIIAREVLEEVQADIDWKD